MSTDTSDYYGGLEGGATHSKMVLIRSDGKVMGWSEGPCTNHWLIGVEECLKRIHTMTMDVKKKAGISESTSLKALGMSLSGGDGVESQIKLKEGVKKIYPNLTKSLYVNSDTCGSLYSALDNGGIVLIAGTGSNCQLINPDMTSVNCGGWGHLLGDEASAYWIAQKAIKMYFDDVDKLIPCEFDTTVVMNIILSYFEIQAKGELLNYFYSNFEKAKIAGLCKELAMCAQKTDDPLCKYVFKEAGKQMAMHILALAPKIDKKLLDCEGGLHIVCVGSVWKSWSLLQPGFMELMSAKGPKLAIKAVTLMDLQISGAIGAASLAARDIKFELPVDRKANAKVFFTSSLP